MLGHSFVNGKIVQTADAKVPIDDIGFLRCFSIYEGITTVGKKPVFLEEHIDRLEQSAAMLGIVCPYTKEQINEIITELASYVTSPRGDIRIVLSGGGSEDGIAPANTGNFYAIVNNMTPLSNFK